jgi:uncharacterized membrane protein YqaE (UPF0057 family)
MSDANEGNKDFVRILVAYFAPPVGVFMQTGFSMALLINCVLTLFFWLPGSLHAVWVISTIGPDGKREEGGGRDFVAHVLGAVFPPAGVFLKQGFSAHFFINCVLLWLMWVPAMVHAAWVISQPAPKAITGK